MRVTDRFNKAGLTLFGVGVIIYLTKDFVISYPAQLFLFVFGSSDSFWQAYIWTYYLPFLLITAGVIVFYIGHKQKNSRPTENIRQNDTK